MRQLLLLIAITALGVTPGQAAVILFQDNFNTESASTVQNFSGFTNWTVSNGTVDYIRSGDLGVTCFGGSGGCVDLDGSTNAGGRLTSRTSYTLVPGGVYTVTVQVSGNQRGGIADVITIGFIGPGILAGTGGITSVTLIGLPSEFPFTLEQFSAAGNGPVRLFFETTSTDNLGPIIDNVMLACDTCPALAVPEPSTPVLLALAIFGIFGFARNHR